MAILILSKIKKKKFFYILKILPNSKKYQNSSSLGLWFFIEKINKRWVFDSLDHFFICSEDKIDGFFVFALKDTKVIKTLCEMLLHLGIRRKPLFFKTPSARSADWLNYLINFKFLFIQDFPWDLTFGLQKLIIQLKMQFSYFDFRYILSEKWNGKMWLNYKMTKLI